MNELTTTTTMMTEQNWIFFQ